MRIRRSVKWLILVVCLGMAAYIVGNNLIVTINKITQQKGYSITEQDDETSLTITIDKNKLPSNMDFEKGVSFKKNQIIGYSSEAGSVYLKHIGYVNSDTEYLTLGFDFDYTLRKEGKVIVPYTIHVEDKKTLTYTHNIFMHSAQVKDAANVFESAASIRAVGPSQQFYIYLKSDVFQDAKETITFTVDGFNTVTYTKSRWIIL